MKKHLRYFSYIIRHKWFVLLAGVKVGAPFHRLLIHDWSKFLPSEWIPYTEFFYGEKPQTTGGSYDPAKGTEAFNRAWLHHQHLNAHHWQHWILREDSGNVIPLEIPYSLVCEMVADWMGAGRAITGTWEVCKWYDRNKDKVQLHPTTRKLVEDLLFLYGSRPLFIQEIEVKS